MNLEKFCINRSIIKMSNKVKDKDVKNRTYYFFSGINIFLFTKNIKIFLFTILDARR